MRLGTSCLRAGRWWCLLALCALASGAAHPAAELVVGQVVPLTGVVAASAKEYVAGAQLYFDHINASGGIAGRKVRVAVRDDEFKPDLTVQRTRELLDSENPIALFGFIGTENVLLLGKSKLLAEARIALVAPLSGAMQLREPMDPQIFHIRASYPEEAARLIQHLHTLGLRRVAIFKQNDQLGHSGADGALKEMQTLGVTLAATGSYERSKPDDVDDAVKVIAASGAQAVLMIAIARPAGLFAKKLRAAGLAVPLYTLSIVNTAELTKYAGEAAVRGIGVTQVMPYPFSPSSAVVREFLLLQSRYAPQLKPSYNAIESFIAAKLLVEGLRRAGPDPTREKLVRALESVRDFDVGNFSLSYSPTNRSGSRYIDIAVIGAEGRLLR
jgi:ABC-type branched-subunit amino acid transport system substrate-binding protein